MRRIASNVLVDNWSRGSLATDWLWIGGLSLLTAVMAQIRIPLPYTPVPLTGQTFAVLLSGAVLGSRRGLASQALYLAAGVSGLPVFAGGSAGLAHLLGSTGGYLWSYPLAAGLVGLLVERGASRKAWNLLLALCLSDAFILVCGALWLHALYGIPYRQASLLGFHPFLIGDMLKIGLVGISLPPVLRHYESRGVPENDA
jgi:biotin transport system substrate-specific component